MTSDSLFPKELLSHPPTRPLSPKFLFLERLGWRGVGDDRVKQVLWSFDHHHGLVYIRGDSTKIIIVPKYLTKYSRVWLTNGSLLLVCTTNNKGGAHLPPPLGVTSFRLGFHVRFTKKRISL